MGYIKKSHDLTYVVIVPHLLRSRAIYFLWFWVDRGLFEWKLELNARLTFGYQICSSSDGRMVKQLL